MHCARRKLALGLSIVAFVACDTSEHEQQRQLDETDAGVEDADAPNADLPDADPPATDQRTGRPCNEMWGTVLVPAAEGAEVLRHSYFTMERLSPAWLNGLPDSVEARTVDGRLLPCGYGVGPYLCSGAVDEDLEKAVVSLGDQEWTETAYCKYFEDPTDFYLTGAAPCVPTGTVVVEGDLLGYDATRALPRVILEGPEQIVIGSLGLAGTDDLRSVVGTHCTVSNGHYACPSVGFRSDEMHAVVVGGARSEVLLPACDVTPVALNVTCPAVPEGLFVTKPGRYDVTASYEGGESYACKPVDSTPRFSTGRRPVYTPGRDYVCPLAPGNERGRGRYNIVARAGNSVYEGSVTDAVDGCGGTGNPVVLTQTF